MSLIFLQIENEKITITHIGDCRAYINGELMTEDHSLAWEKLSARGKENFEVSNLTCKHPRRNILTRSIKHTNKNIIISSLTKEYSGSNIILCTDGFWSLNHLDIINKEFKPNTKKSYDDNYTAIILNI